MSDQVNLDLDRDPPVSSQSPALDLSHIAAAEQLGRTCKQCDQCHEIKVSKGTPSLFLKSVSVWVNKPHVVNRRLCGTKIIAVFRGCTKVEVFESFQRFIKENKHNEIQNGHNDNGNNYNFKDLATEESEFTLVFRKLIPKSEFFHTLLEAVIYDKLENIVHFLPINETKETKDVDVCLTQELEYSVQFKAMKENIPALAHMNEIILRWSCDHADSGKTKRQMSSQWLRTVLLEKLVSWSHINNICTSVTSLQLVSVDKYKDTYVRLKNTYGRDLVKNWTERTDPHKFVYEDIAIAAYLMLIWEEDRKQKKIEKKQTFVDLGCGNGLLVYILTREGHKGLGIDLRRRKIWDSFGTDIELKEEVISPSAKHLFPKYDWIIGNHSDELTPWIPVIAARSSYECCFFVLPCCHHDFVGKFGLTEKGKSQYGSYLDYVKQIICKCGFQPESDTLRIPSTKRVCFIGKQRSYELQSEAVVDVERQKFIDQRISHTVSLVSKKRKLSSPYRTTVTSLAQVEATPDEETTCGSDCGQPQDYRASNQSTTDGNIGSVEIFARKAYSEELGVKEDVVHLRSPAVNVNVKDAEGFAGSVEGDSKTTVCKQNNSTPKRCKMEAVSEFLDIDMPYGHLAISDTHSERATQLSGNVESVKSLETDSGCLGPGGSHLMRDMGADKNGLWAEEFKPRVEHGVRNCQRVAEATKSKIVAAVFELVLGAEGSTEAELEDGRSWRKGGCVPISDAVKLFDKVTLQELKAECGGLQTLLRNHSHIFQVTGGKIRLRDFSVTNPWEGKASKKGRGKEGTLRTVLCWFHNHHPDGCPRPNSGCLFAHGFEELRKKTV